MDTHACTHVHKEIALTSNQSNILPIPRDTCMLEKVEIYGLHAITDNHIGALRGRDEFEPLLLAPINNADASTCKAALLHAHIAKPPGPLEHLGLLPHWLEP